MRQFFKSGSVRGVRSNPHPYRDRFAQDDHTQFGATPYAAGAGK